MFLEFNLTHVIKGNDGGNEITVLWVDSCYFSSVANFHLGSLPAPLCVILVGQTITGPCFPITGIVICP